MGTDEANPKASTPLTLTKKAEMRKSWSEIEKCEVCEKFDQSGANAYVERKTCLRCGAVTTTKHDKKIVENPGTGQPFLPTECPHRHTNHTGSS